MGVVSSFPPVAGRLATRLVLGSIPGRASLDAQQYYAHPRNAFWPIMGAVLNFSAQLAYAERCRALIRSGVALWDVLGECDRPGSLDAAVMTDSMVLNDFAQFFEQHPRINVVFCNGVLAEKTYLRRVKPILTEPFDSLPVIRLPSTSPAHAALSFEQKLAQWRQVGEA